MMVIPEKDSKQNGGLYPMTSVSTSTTVSTSKFKFKRLFVDLMESFLSSVQPLFFENLNLENSACRKMNVTH